ncbi:hypothetical protein EV144_103348 [Flavobacterium sp. 270]|nr:hypothetical protein EV144_103348 [Flavobacterium sp. 270]
MEKEYTLHRFVLNTEQERFNIKRDNRVTRLLWFSLGAAFVFFVNLFLL